MERAEDDLDEDAQPYWNAFAVLSHKRYVFIGGMGGVIDQPIIYEAISQYAADFGFKTGPRCPVFADFLHLMTKMDEVFLEHMQKVRDEQAKRAQDRQR